MYWGLILLINNKEYIYKCDYKGDEKARESFNKLTEKTYGFNFREWYNKGQWQDKYIPYSLFDEDKAIANVSVNIMDTVVCGYKQRFIQLGTVMTDKDYRGQGLSKFLMKKVIEEWEDKCDFLYLFANDSVLDFYPKFGFKKYNEYQYSIDIFEKDNNLITRKLNIDNLDDRSLFMDIFNNDKYEAKLSQKANKDLLMFYCDNFLKNNIYYIEEFNVIAICEYDNEVLNLQELFSKKEVDLKRIINVLVNEQTKKVILGFTPKDILDFKENILQEEDTTLFIRGKVGELFEKEKLMFSLLAHA